MTSVLIRERQVNLRQTEEKTQRREEGNVTTEAKIRVIWPQVKECIQLPEAGGGQRIDPCVELLEGVQLGQHLDFRLLASKTV